MTIAKCDFDLPSDLAVLAGNNQFDSAELILRQAVVENFEHTIDATIEFSFLRFSIIRTAHGIRRRWEAFRVCSNLDAGAAHDCLRFFNSCSSILRILFILSPMRPKIQMTAR